VNGAALLALDDTEHRLHLPGPDVAVESSRVCDRPETRHDLGAVELPDDEMSEETLERSTDAGDDTLVGRVARRKDQPGLRKVRLGAPTGCVGPIDQHRTVRAIENVEWMNVEVHDALSAIGELREPVRRLDVVKPTMEIGKDSRVPRERPRTSRDRIEHRRAIDTVHHYLGAVRAHIVDRRDRETSGADMLHHPGLVCDVPRVPGAPKHAVGAVFEDVPVAAAGKQASHLALHASEHRTGASRRGARARMASMRTGRHRLVVLATAIAMGLATFAAPASARGDSTGPDVRFEQLDGFPSPGTPDKYNKVGVIETGRKDAKNVLVLVPGTSASAAYFEPIAKDIVAKNKGWQVWAVERRENLLEDHSMLDKVKAGKATPEQLFEYYLGFITDPTITTHFEFIPDADVAYAKDWGMQIAVEDLHRVIAAAKKHGGKVVLGGHSLGGSITTAYATWDFGGKPGAKDLAGLVYIDGGSSPTPVTPDAANLSLLALQSGSPWLTFGGITAPYAGLFNAVASTTVHQDPDEPSRLQTWPVLPANLKPPVPTTGVAAYGYALDVKTSPPGLVAAQAHLGQLAASGDPRGWERAGAITPIQRYAEMFSGTGLEGHDGTAWYHPQRLTIDSGAVAAGNANPTQEILALHATHGRDLPKRLRIYAFGAALGGQRVLDAARILAEQSGIPSDQLTLVDRHDTYSHNDPSSASPANEFLQNITPFLNQLAG